MAALGESAPGGRPYRVYLVGGGTAVYAGWRETSIDVDLFSDDDAVFRDIQRIKERLNVNVKFARPEHLVPPLAGSGNRQVYIGTSGTVSFYHYDPYAQVFSKIVRGFERDLQDGRAFVTNAMVDPAVLRDLMEGIPESAYAKYPNLTGGAVVAAVKDFITSL